MKQKLGDPTWPYKCPQFIYTENEEKKKRNRRRLSWHDRMYGWTGPLGRRFLERLPR